MNIVLCGFMGAGKTRIGKEISKLTGREFIDTDDIAEKIAGKKIADIFAESGEAEFRKIETKACEAAAKHENAVISTGGGAVTFPQNTEILKKSGAVVFIDTSFSEIVKRVGDASSRPLFKNKQNAEKLYNERKSKYSAACDITVNGDFSTAKTANEIINKTTELLNNRNYY